MQCRDLVQRFKPTSPLLRLTLVLALAISQFLVPGGLFVPSHVYAVAIGPGGVSSNLSIWYTASNYNTTTGVWTDKGPNALNGTTNPGPTESLPGCSVNPNVTGTVVQQSSGLNFNPSLSLTSALRKLRTPTLTGNRDVYMVVRYAATQPTGNTPHGVFGMRDVSNEVGIRASSSTQWASPGNANDFTGTAGSATYVNGVAGATHNNQWHILTAQRGTSAGLTGNYYIGGYYDTDCVGTINKYRDFTGDVAEVLVYNSANNTSAARQQIESYLAAKYGITLGNTTTPATYTASDGSTTYWTSSATYQTNVTVIGRDDDSALNQKQAVSINPSALMTMGLGTIATDNASNSNTFAADKNFEVFGDDNGAISSFSAIAGDTPPGNVRIAREWKVQETGTVGTVKIRVPDDSSSATTKLPSEPPTGKVVLLVDADGNFSTGATPIPMTLVGTNWEATVDFTAASGYYFTIASDATPPTITSINSTTPDGTYGSGATINVTVNLSEAVAATSLALALNASGSASVTVTCANTPCTTLSGSYTIVAGDNTADLNVTGVTGTLTDIAGNVQSTPFTTIPVGQNLANLRAIIFDTTASSAPSVTSPASNGVTNDNTPTVAGTGASGDTIKVRDESNTLLCTATVQANGSWNCTPTTPLPDGPHTLNITATDPAGNTSPATSVPITVDTVAPGAPTVTSPTAGGITNDNTPTITGTGTSGDTITVRDESNTLICTATVQANGSWNCTPTTPLPDNPHTLSVTAIDPAGNVSTPTTVPFTVDTTAPSAPTVTSPTAGGITNDTTPTVAGTGTSGDTITVRDESNTLICTATVQANGSWSCTPTTALPDGAHILSVTATDAAGNTGPATSAPFTVNSAAVSTPAIISPATGSSTNDTTPTISGNADPGATVTVKDETNATLCTATVQVDGSWNCTPTTPLSEASHTITAVATNSASTASTPATSTFTVDTTAPSAPSVTAPAASATTNDNTPTITGTGASGDTITVRDESNTLLCTATVQANGSWSCTPTTALPDGPHTLSVTATDPASNVSTPTTLPFTVDATAPSAPSVTAPAASATTNDNTPTITGTGTSGDTITVRDESGTLICTATVQANGSWSCTPTTALPDNPHTLSVTAIDPAGNVSTPTTVPFTVDTTAPSAPTVTSPTAGGITNDTTPTVAGTGTSGDTITVRDESNTLICTATVQANGSWSCTPTTALPDGAHILSVTATDAAGNTGQPTSAPFTVDRSAVSTPAIISPATGSSTNDTTPTISGNADPGATVTVKGETGATLCTATVQSDGSWSCTPTTPLSEASHTLTAVATNSAGTASTPATSTFTVDTTAPSAPTVTSPTTSGSITNDTTPTITGTGTSGDTITVRDESGTLICTATVQADGSWGCTPTTPLPDGTHTLSVTTTDLGGNTSPPTSAPFIVDTTPPGAPTIISPAAGSSTTDSTPTITGNGVEPGALVTVLNGTTPICTAIADANGNWSCTPTAPLSNGAQTLKATATDRAGNTSQPTAVSFTISSGTKRYNLYLPIVGRP